MFVMCFYAHVNESNIIAGRADALWDEVAREGPSRLTKVASIQQMVRKVKPNFFSPYTVFKSLLGERESFKLVNIQLANLIEKNKNGLVGVSLVQVDVENGDLSEADMLRVDLEGANLSAANFSRANLIAAKLNFANFHGASFLQTHVFKAVFSGAILKRADLRHAVGLTCEQIQSAVIDESTRLPDYISLAGTSESSFRCVNVLKGEGVDLSGVNLADTYLYNLDLRKSNLSRANLEKAILNNTFFQNADLGHANLKGANLRFSLFTDANLTGTDLRGTDLRGSHLDRVVGLTCEQVKSALIDKSTRLPSYILLAGSSESTFKCIYLKKGKKVDLSGENLAGTYLRDLDLRKSNLSRANFEKAVLSNKYFQNADLGHANLKGANLTFSYFNDANLTGSDLRGADLDRAVGLTCEQIESAVIDESTRLPDYISLAGFSESTFKCINLKKGKGVDLSRVNLADTYLRNMDLRKSNLSRANFEKAILDYTFFQSADLGHANLKGANLTFSYFNDANLTGTDLRGANLDRAVGLTCEQVKSAVIDKDTHLPSYISLECENSQGVKTVGEK